MIDTLEISIRNVCNADAATRRDGAARENASVGDMLEIHATCERMKEKEAAA